MGAKDALCKIAHLNCGLPDTLAYYTPEEFKAGFYKTMAYQPRVIKQNRGSSGEGIWIIKLKDRNYCPTLAPPNARTTRMLDMMEANDNHAEEHTVAEFIEFCINGRTDKSGTWTSKGVGKYLEGGKEAGGMLVDQRFCPRIVEGELRYNCVGPKLVSIIHKKPAEGGISAVGGTGSVYTFYGPDEPKFKNLTNNFLTKDIDKVMPALGLERADPAVVDDRLHPGRTRRARRRRRRSGSWASSTARASASPSARRAPLTRDTADVKGDITRGGPRWRRYYGG